MAGDNVLFSVSATSPGPLTYQWRFNGTNIAGATTGTLAITNAQPSNTGYYDVLVCSSFGCVTSQVATLSFKIANLQMMAVVTVQGMVGANTRVEWSPDLITWSTLTNFVLPASPYRVPDWDSLGQPQKFYRVLFLP